MDIFKRIFNSWWFQMYWKRMEWKYYLKELKFQNSNFHSSPCALIWSRINRSRSRRTKLEWYLRLKRSINLDEEEFFIAAILPGKVNVHRSSSLSLAFQLKWNVSSCKKSSSLTGFHDDSVGGQRSTASTNPSSWRLSILPSLRRITRWLSTRAGVTDTDTWKTGGTKDGENSILD